MLPVSDSGLTKQDVHVVTTRGTLTADVVVVTVPLGVLKANVLRFAPPLPPSKQLAMHRLGFGLLNKLVIEFPRVFWNPAEKLIGCVSGHRYAVAPGACAHPA